MREFKDVVSKLNEFTSADDLAAHFEEHDIRAKPGGAYSCAITEYVRKEIETPFQMNVATSFDYIDQAAVAYVAYNAAPGLRFQEYLSPVASEFIRRFDKEQYPNLVKGDGETNA